MAVPDRLSLPYTNQSEQGVLNESRDEKYKVLAVELLTENEAGTALERVKTGSISSTYATRLDDSATPVLYIGKAPIGSATSAAVWQIAKLDTSSGLIKTWASNSFDQIWNNRVSLTYS